MSGNTLNLKAAKLAIELFHSGKVDLMRHMLADDVVWGVPKKNPLAADLVGIEEVITFFKRVQEETEGTFRAEVTEIAANEQAVFCVMHVRAERKGRKLDQKVVNVWKLRPADNKVYARELYMEDQPASDEFWAF
jgi:hypothetical protein